jgi:hypothetical protein
MPGKARMRKSTGIPGLLRAFSASGSPEKPGAVPEMPVSQARMRREFVRRSRGAAPAPTGNFCKRSSFLIMPRTSARSPAINGKTRANRRRVLGNTIDDVKEPEGGPPTGAPPRLA